MRVEVDVESGQLVAVSEVTYESSQRVSPLGLIHTSVSLNILDSRRKTSSRPAIPKYAQYAMSEVEEYEVGALVVFPAAPNNDRPVIQRT